MIVGRGTPYSVVVAALLIIWTVQPGFAQESKTSDEARRPRLGGPNAVENQLESDRAEKDVLYESKLLKPYFEWQASLKEKYGFSFGIDYTAAFLKATDSLPRTDDYASSGMVRFYGSWELIRRSKNTTGALVYRSNTVTPIRTPQPAGFLSVILGTWV
jgi:porin